MTILISIGTFIQYIIYVGAISYVLGYFHQKFKLGARLLRLFKKS